MATYTVHEPRPRKGKGAPPATTEAERFMFVRDGFHFWAFILGPVWMLWHRMWLVLVGYIVGLTAVEIGLWAVGASFGMKFTVGFLIALLVGFEAATLRRWTYRKWTMLGVVVGSDLETAERRFFDAWIARGSAPAPVLENLPPAPSLRMPSVEPGVIGLFPEPEPRS
jgi:hypothetical protein